MGDDRERKVDAEKYEARERSAPSGRIVYQAILQEGLEELERPSSALLWSGLAAGLSMGASLITEGLLRNYLPKAEWEPLVSKFGYAVGYLIVILGRQQLFTENTLTPILPLFRRPSWETLRNVLRLWAIVLTANLVGGVAVAWALTQTNAFEPSVREEFLAIGRAALEHGPATILLRGILAGWLVALLVWLLPFAETGRVWVIIILTYLIGLGQLSHVIAGSIAVAAAGFGGASSWGHLLLAYVLPALVGNMIGGVTLVAALNHAQVVSGRDESDLPSDKRE